MSSESEELDRLDAALQEARSEFRLKYRQLTSMDLMIPVGLKKRHVFQVEVISISWIVQLLNFVCFVAGISIIFLGGVMQTIGVSLIVGSLFAEGAFVGQWWAITAQNNYMAYYRLWGDEKFARLEELKEKMAQLSEQANRLRAESVLPPDSNKPPERPGHAGGHEIELLEPLPASVRSAGRPMRCPRVSLS